MSQPALAGFRCHCPARRGVMTAVPENGPSPAAWAGRKPEPVQRKKTNGLMKRGGTRGMRPGDCWRQWLADALLLVAFAALALQAGAHFLRAEHMIHAEPTVAAALDQGCDHFHAAAECVRPISKDMDASGGSAPASQGDCCNQFCTIIALLPESARANPLPSGETCLGILMDRLGQTPGGILRPPQSPIAA